MPVPEAGRALTGVGVLVTRPRHQSQSLCRMIAAEGGHSVSFPVIEIVAPDNMDSAMALVGRLEEFDLAIFISANAVEQADKVVKRVGRWPSQLRLAAIGRSSAEALQACGLHADIVPAQGFNREALLALPEMHDVGGRHIVIFRGQGGRELLAAELARRGANVEYAEVYRRRCPAGGLESLQDELDGIDVIVVASNESLQNLYDMAADDHRDWLLSRPLVVISHRAAEHAATLGFQKSITVADEASNEGLLSALIRSRDLEESAE